MRRKTTTIVPDMTGTRVLFIDEEGVVMRYPIVAWKIDVEPRSDGGEDLIFIKSIIGDVMDADPEDVNCAQLTEYTVNGIPHMWICYDKSFFDYTLAVDTALQEHRRMNRVAAEVVASIDAKK